MFLIGDFVLSLLFDLPSPQHAEVVLNSDHILPIDEIRHRFLLPSDCSVSVHSEPPPFSFNSDYWVLVPNLGLITLNPLYPVTQELKIIDLKTPEDALRLLAIAVSFPWPSLATVDIGTPIAIAATLLHEDPTAADLVALRYSDFSAAHLISKAGRLGDTIESHEVAEST